MKKLFFILLPVLAFSVAVAQKSMPVDLKIESGKFFMNGVQLDNWQVAPVVDILGSNARVQKKSNNIHVYDSAGLSLYEEIIDDKPNDRLVEIHVFFDPAKTKWEKPSAQKYAGKFTIDGFAITPKLGYVQLKAREKNVTLTKSYKPHSYFFKKDGLTYFFDFNDAETGLVRVSVGKED
jgi:hypothetical protein